MEFKTDTILENLRLDNAVISLCKEFSRSKVQNNYIKVNSKKAKASYKLKAGDIIEIIEKEDIKPAVKAQNIPLDIIYEDDYLIVLNKQKGILTHPTPLNKENSLVNVWGWGKKQSFYPIYKELKEQALSTGLIKTLQGLFLLQKQMMHILIFKNKSK